MVRTQPQEFKAPNFGPRAKSTALKRTKSQRKEMTSKTCCMIGNIPNHLPMNNPDDITQIKEK